MAKADLILVTGGAGFIGSNTVDRLLELNYRVRVLDDFSHGRRANLKPHDLLEVIEGDIRDVAAVENAAKNVDRVLHLAAQISVEYSIEDPVASNLTNVVGFINVLNACLQANVKKLVYASSSAIYGLGHAHPIAETTAPDPCSPYGIEKQINELYANWFATLHGMNILGLRYFNVYGQRQRSDSAYASVIASFIANGKANKPLKIFGDGKQARDFIHVADVADINAQSLFSDLVGVVNVGTGIASTIEELAETVTASRSTKKEIVYLNARPSDLKYSCANIEKLVRHMKASNFTTLKDGIAGLVQAAD